MNTASVTCSECPVAMKNGKMLDVEGLNEAHPGRRDFHASYSCALLVQCERDFLCKAMSRKPCPVHLKQFSIVDSEDLVTVHVKKKLDDSGVSGCAW